MRVFLRMGGAVLSGHGSRVFLGRVVLGVFSGAPGTLRHISRQGASLVGSRAQSLSRRRAPGAVRVAPGGAGEGEVGDVGGGNDVQYLRPTEERW